ncbi:MAG: hypothetical protein M1831_000277 [Alyxoria varia]|nr:MAG: hypothetical protein M1831_000277 [Alyxoria varia]
MAAASGRYRTGPSGLGTSPSNADEGFWSYAVPSQNENSSEPAKQNASSNGSTFYQEARQPLAQHQNSSIRPKTRHTVKSKTSIDGPRLGNSATLRPPVNEQAEHSGVSSENDSLLDLYKGNPERPSRTTSRDRSKAKRKSSRSAAASTVHEESVPHDPESKWIHRDKLAQIESRELAEMGLRVGRPSRASSRKSVRTRKSSTDMAEQQEQEEEYAAIREGKRQRQTSPDHTEQVQDHQYQEVQEASPPRSEEPPSSIPRPGTSRIPVSRNTPPSGLNENGYSDSPSGPRRKRSAGSLGNMKARSRSQSGNSQNLLNFSNEQDTPETPTNGISGSPTSPQSSPQKGRVASKGAPSTGNRAVSANRKASGQQQPRQRSVSTTSNKESRRPGTSSGPRPPTARPEGEAPWIATMYKPDPRIPPEEQMLPTHAKRLAQAQGKQSQDDSEFRLVDSEDSRLDGDDNGDKARSPDGTADPRKSSARKRDSAQGYDEGRMSEKRASGQWPLRTPSGQMVQSHQGPRQYLQQQQSHNQRPQQFSPIKTEPEIWIGGNGGATEQNQRSGSYSAARPANSPGNGNNSAAGYNRNSKNYDAPVNQPVKLKEEKDDSGEKKKKGCGCCVVM